VGRSGKERKISNLSSMGRARRLAREELELELCGVVFEGEEDEDGNGEAAIGGLEVAELSW